LITREKALKRVREREFYIYVEFLAPVPLHFYLRSILLNWGVAADIYSRSRPQYGVCAMGPSTKLTRSEPHVKLRGAPPRLMSAKLFFFSQHPVDSHE
jgi:hypothetical protein